jgi:uncharacterized BrkB/YihY/UPF0761 family membrane protein
MFDEMTLTGAADVTAILFLLAALIYWLVKRRKRERWEDVYPGAYRDWHRPTPKPWRK